MGRHMCQRALSRLFQKFSLTISLSLCSKVVIFTLDLLIKTGITFLVDTVPKVMSYNFIFPERNSFKTLHLLSTSYVSGLVSVACKTFSVVGRYHLLPSCPLIKPHPDLKMENENWLMTSDWKQSQSKQAGMQPTCAKLLRGQHIVIWLPPSTLS